MLRSLIFSSALWLPHASAAFAASKCEEQVREEMRRVGIAPNWACNDLGKGQATEQADAHCVSWRPMTACATFDGQVAHRDAVIRELMDQFVCVRVIAYFEIRAYSAADFSNGALDTKSYVALYDRSNIRTTEDTTKIVTWVEQYFCRNDA